MSFWEDFKKAPPSITKDVTMPAAAWEKIKSYGDVAAKLELRNGDIVVTVPKAVTTEELRKLTGHANVHEVIDVEGRDV